jgi:hypothetical protein
MNLIDAEFDQILFRGISEGCVLIHTEMQPLLLPRIRKLGIFSAFIFQNYEISDIYSESTCLYSKTKDNASCDEQLQFSGDKYLLDPREHVSMIPN